MDNKQIKETIKKLPLTFMPNVISVRHARSLPMGARAPVLPLTTRCVAIGLTTRDVISCVQCLGWLILC